MKPQWKKFSEEMPECNKKIIIRGSYDDIYGATRDGRFLNVDNFEYEGTENVNISRFETWSWDYIEEE